MVAVGRVLVINWPEDGINAMEEATGVGKPLAGAALNTLNEVVDEYIVGRHRFGVGSEDCRGGTNPRG